MRNSAGDGYSHAWAAEALGKSEGSISHILHGRVRMTLADYMALCDVLGVAYTRFLPEPPPRDKTWRPAVSQRIPKTYAARREAGLCPVCGGARDVPGRKTCEKCLMRKRRQTAIKKAVASEHRREQRQKNRAEGLCRCGRPVTPGYQTCVQCRLSQRAASMAHYRRQHGLPQKQVQKPDLTLLETSARHASEHPALIAICENCKQTDCGYETGCKEYRDKLKEIRMLRREARGK